MSTILILNGISSLTAAIGLGGYAIRARRRAQREDEARRAYLPRGDGGARTR